MDTLLERTEIKTFDGGSTESSVGKVACSNLTRGAVLRS